MPFFNPFTEIKHAFTDNPITKNARKVVEVNPFGSLPIDINPFGGSGKTGTGFLGKIPGISDNHMDDLRIGLNPIAASEQFIHMRGTEKGKKVGTVLETLGQGASIVGTATGQPEISALGTGLTVAGGYEKGDKPAEIIGEAVGSYLGGRYLGGASVGGQVIGSSVGSAIGGKIGGEGFKALEGLVDSRPGGRNHTDQLKEQVAENSHKSDGMEHHNSGVLPSDLKPDGFSKAPTGETANQPHHATSQEGQQLEDEIQTLQNTQQVISYMVDNLPIILALSQADRNEVLDEVLDSGLVDEILQAAISA
jgi:hypothetical protein